MIILFKNLVRIIIFIFSIYLVRAYLYRQQIDAIGLGLVLLVLSIIFAGTFVISFKENSKKIGGDGKPSYVSFLMVMGSLSFIMGIAAILTGQTWTVGQYSSRLINVHDDKFMYWLTVLFHFQGGFLFFWMGWITKRRGRK